MAGCAILSAIGGAIAITSLVHLNAVGAAYVNVVPVDERADAADLVANVHSDLLLHAVVGIAGLVALALLSVAVRRPWRKARIAAWISALVLSFGLALVLAGSPEILVAPDTFDSPAVRSALNDLLAGWYPALTSVLVAIQLAATFAFSVLLLRADSAEFYRPRHEDAPDGLWTFAPRSDST